MFKKMRKLTTTQMIAYGFLGAIIIGTILLSLPISSKSGTATNLLDSLFSATTSICVTGLTTLNTLQHWSLFGQLVILFLMQIGGWGVITFTTIILMIFGKRITLRDRLLIQEAYNLDTLRGLVKLTIKILKGSLVVEGIGAFFYALVYVPQFGLISGIWKGIFNSVSAFCNAGMDLVGDSSLIPYQDNIIINIVTMLLIIMGGIGFPVWWDLVKNIRKVSEQKVSIKHFFEKLELHSKLVLSITAVLVFSGAMGFFLLEYTNSSTIGNLSFGNKIMASFFQSVTTRTAGFATIPQENLRDGSIMLSLILMFIGGSPSGTAGGVKTVTFGILVLVAISIAKGNNDVEIFKRKIGDSYIKKSLSVIMFSFMFVFISTLLLSIVENAPFLDAIYETVSALATVGLSRNFTGSLDTIGKCIIIICMYAGRIGPISMALAFNISRKSKLKGRQLPEEQIIVG